MGCILDTTEDFYFHFLPSLVFLRPFLGTTLLGRHPSQISLLPLLPSETVETRISRCCWQQGPEAGKAGPALALCKPQGSEGSELSTWNREVGGGEGLNSHSSVSKRVLEALPPHTWVSRAAPWRDNLLLCLTHSREQRDALPLDAQGHCHHHLKVQDWRDEIDNLELYIRCGILFCMAIGGWSTIQEELFTAYRELGKP